MKTPQWFRSGEEVGKNKLPAVLPEDIEKALYNFVLNKFEGPEAHLLKLIKIPQELQRGTGVWVMPGPYTGTLELVGDGPNTYTLRYILRRPHISFSVDGKKDDEQILQLHEPWEGITAQTLQKALEGFWKVCEEQSPRSVSEPSHHPRYPSNGHEDVDRLLGKDPKKR